MRPALQLAQLAQTFSCSVVLHKDDRAVNAKNLVELMTLAAEQGATLVLEAEGDGSDEAVDVLAKLFETNFKVD
jgi:phosphotransferase system HPr (HPr) family protein